MIWGRSSTHIAWVDVDRYRFDRHIVTLYRGRQPLCHVSRKVVGTQGEGFLRERLMAVGATEKRAGRTWLKVTLLWVLLIVAFVVIYNLVAQP